MAAESRGRHEEPPAAAAAAATPPSSVAAVSASTGTGAEGAVQASGEAGATEGVSAAVVAQYECSQWDDGLKDVFVALNVARMEAAKERQSFQDKRVFKDPKLAVVAAGGQVLALRRDGRVVAVCALVKAVGSYELKYVAVAAGTSAASEDEMLGVLVHHATLHAQANSATQLLALFSGPMADAERKWTHHGFRVAGVGPGPEYAVKLARALPGAQ